ncbi:MAG: aminotransferase class IV [Thalassobaculum sp.]|uniref:aminotransferase class IV n=1 Tax=Thalassobaculum sp. TaxID=2022740 RepID=UPI0032EFA9F8
MADSDSFAAGATFVDGDYVPIGRAAVSVLYWGFTKSDVTYDVVHVWRGAFFRLDDHLARFARSMAALRMTIPHDAGQQARILAGCVQRAGLADAYVAMVATRGVPLFGMPRRPSLMTNRYIAYAIPWIDVIPVPVQERGAHLIVASTPRIPSESVDPTVRNYHWGDLVQAMFEAEAAGADNAVLLDRDGHVTEGPGFNVFAVRDGVVLSPDRGALEGVTRQTVIDICAELGLELRIGPMTRADLYEADEIFTSTTAGGVMPAARIDGRILSNDRPGPVSRRIRETYWAWHEEGRHLTPVAGLV